jgi:signal transduction histidine kinase
MRRLIGDLLDSSRIEAGKFSVEPRPQYAESIVEEAVEMFRPLALQKKVTVTAEIGGALPPVFCDRERIMQVLSNLVGNALKFTPSQGAVTIKASPRDRHVVFEVRDTGVGIEKEHLQHIFDRYWTKGAEKRGTGLGLFISKGIVEAHKGSIWAQSSSGAGSTFYFTLPVANETPSFADTRSGTGG